jgi:hypothetical protein
MWSARNVCIAAALAASVLIACGDDDDPEPLTVHQRPAMGYSLTIPDGWHRAAHSLTPTITDPVEMVSLATAPFERGESVCRALDRVVPSGAFVTVQERMHGGAGAPGFPPRPAEFRPRPAVEGNSTWAWCGRRDSEPPLPIDHYWFGFSDRGRAFHVLVAFGKDAPEAVRAEAFALLDSLQLAPAEPARRLMISAPEGWRRAGGPVDQLTTNPIELVVLSTFEVPRFEEASDRCGPFYDNILDHMPDHGGLLAIRERLGNDVAGPPNFPDRPAAFELKPTDPERGGCHSEALRTFRRWFIPFETEGRDFYAQVELGVNAPDARRREAERILDSFDPR